MARKVNYNSTDTFDIFRQKLNQEADYVGNLDDLNEAHGKFLWMLRSFTEK